MSDGRGQYLDSCQHHHAFLYGLRGTPGKWKNSQYHMHIWFSDTFFSINSHLGKERAKGGGTESLADLWYAPMIFPHCQLSISGHSWGWSVVGMWPEWCVGPPDSGKYSNEGLNSFIQGWESTRVAGSRASSSLTLYSLPLCSHGPVQTDLV